MSSRPVSKDNSLTLALDQVNYASNTDSSSDKLSLDNLALHRPKCPWRKRQSYIERLKKPIFYESSINCIQRHSRQPSGTKKTSTLCSKYPKVWQRPFSKIRQGQINCFCKRQEQAKRLAFSQKQRTQDWIENRRNYIINKFDNFSKNILKITGKLSRDTVAKITAKIEENLVKNYELRARNINNSSAGMSLSTTNYELSTARDRSSCDRLLQVPSSKIIPNVSCLNVALIPPDTKILASNCPVNNNTVSMDQVNCISAKEARSEIHLSCVISASIGKEINAGKTSVGIQECLQRLESSNIKNYPLEGAFMSQEKPASAGTRTFDATDKKPEDKTASNVFESYGDSVSVKKYISYKKGKSASAGEKGSQLVTDFSANNNVSDNMYTGNHINNINKKPKSAGGYFNRRHSTKNQIRMFEKNVSFSETNYISTKSKNKPLSANINTVTPIQRHSFTVHEKSTHDRISPVSFVEKPWPGKVYDEYDKDKFNLKAPSQSHLQTKRQVKVTSKINEMKPSLVKNLQLTSSTNVLCKPSKNALHFSRKKKILVDRNKNLCSQANSSEGTTGYTVQLVKLKNYQGSKTSRKQD